MVEGCKMELPMYIILALPFVHSQVVIEKSFNCQHLSNNWFSNITQPHTKMETGLSSQMKCLTLCVQDSECSETAYSERDGLCLTSITEINMTSLPNYLGRDLTLCSKSEYLYSTFFNLKFFKFVEKENFFLFDPWLFSTLTHDKQAEDKIFPIQYSLQFYWKLV